MSNLEKEDLILRETCCLIEIAAWNYYAGCHYPGYRFKHFLVKFSKCSRPEAEFIWLFFRNISVHIGDLPVTASFELLPLQERLTEYFNESMKNFEIECETNGIDPAPLLYRQKDLIQTKLKLLKNVEVNKEERLIRGILGLHYM